MARNQGRDRAVAPGTASRHRGPRVTEENERPMNTLAMCPSVTAGYCSRWETNSRTPNGGRLKEKVMRKRITLAAAAALFSAAALMSGPAQAMPFGSPSGVRGAAEAVNPSEKTACRRYGGLGWGRASAG